MNEANRDTDIVIFWRQPYPKFLLQYFEQCNIQLVLRELFESDRNKLNRADGIIILAELNWNGKKLSDFYGFEILCQLRTEHRLRCPIAVCSFMPENYLKKKFPILEFPQHHPFIRLPASPETFAERIQKAEIADEPRLNDIISSYCDPRGRLIKLLTHGKGFRRITRNVQVNTPDDSLWSDCNEDLALLRNYLVNKLLGSSILSLGNTLAAKLEESIRTRNLQGLLSAKSLFDSLLSELAKAKVAQSLT